VKKKKKKKKKKRRYCMVIYYDSATRCNRRREEKRREEAARGGGRSCNMIRIHPPKFYDYTSKDVVWSFSASISCIFVMFARYRVSSTSATESPNSFSNCSLVSRGTADNASDRCRPISASAGAFPSLRVIVHTSERRGGVERRQRRS